MGARSGKVLALVRMGSVPMVCPFLPTIMKIWAELLKKTSERKEVKEEKIKEGKKIKNKKLCTKPL